MKATLLLLLCFGVLAPTQGKLYYGTKHTIPKVAGAYARAYVNLGKTPGAPAAVGVEVTASFLANLNKLPVILVPIPALNFTLRESPSWLDVPRQDAQPFSRIFFNYEAVGHPPIGIYSKTHFDFHFTFNNATAWNSMFDNTNKTMGPCGGANPAIFKRTFEPVPAQCFPNKTHTQLGDFVYGHGSHLYPLGAPEFNPPRLFNQTLIFGSWGGEIQFIEPMAALEYLNSTRVRSSKGDWYPTRAPTLYKTARYYPTQYGFYWNKKQTSLFIELKSYKMSKVCTYNPKLGWADWFPSTGTVPGPPSICAYPTPATWKYP